MRRNPQKPRQIPEENGRIRPAQTPDRPGPERDYPGEASHEGLDGGDEEERQHPPLAAAERHGQRRVSEDQASSQSAAADYEEVSQIGAQGPDDQGEREALHRAEEGSRAAARGGGGGEGGAVCAGAEGQEVEAQVDEVRAEDVPGTRLRVQVRHREDQQGHEPAEAGVLRDEDERTQRGQEEQTSETGLRGSSRGFRGVLCGESPSFTCGQPARSQAGFCWIGQVLSVVSVS
mmetsp:Transcript_9038/g.16580  ORF Transcript_9038/g.16580 Transcript_9038/m.16580 type:complete len:233 (-) Transcript_9038:182-880(-)